MIIYDRDEILYISGSIAAYSGPQSTFSGAVATIVSKFYSGNDKNQAIYVTQPRASRVHRWSCTMFAEWKGGVCAVGQRLD